MAQLLRAVAYQSNGFLWYKIVWQAQNINSFSSISSQDGGIDTERGYVVIDAWHDERLST